MNLVFVGHRCCDHSPSSGYDQICSLFPEAGWLSGPDLAAGQLTWFREPSDGNTSLTAASHQIFHVFYGDCSGSALPVVLRARFPQATIVSTVHQPASRLVGDEAARASLNAADGIITVSETQARELARFELTASIHAVPHGVWTKAFRPSLPLAQDARDNVLFVGNYLRDWNATKHIVEMLAVAGVRSVVVGSAAPDRLKTRDPLIEMAPRVSEAELAMLYDRAAALVLPVLDATASNAVLESMAAGCPVICPRLPSLTDEYLGDGSDAYEQSRYDVAVSHALRYVGHPERRAARSRLLMKRAESFDWSRLLPLFTAIYRDIITGTTALPR
ncbi:glycosyltransferase family 4 protein [Streptomyces galilaeus]|uniref:glycosyltransferase family 4 protein n=1 Tax=Streptomyces galilaeus TaxID=33899 RepID=UPI001671A759|nr:glycosyltransferase family 4 protein [Streptomyces galilaeus]GGW85965.1 hypothetical protein GCM10010350_83080 [Streptomyces galilaeus]